LHVELFMPTVTQVARIANVAANTVRNYARDYPDLFSEGATKLQGTRIFNEDDIEVVCSLVALKNSGLTLNEAVERLRGSGAPPVIDVAATPVQQPANALQAPHAPLALLSRIEAIERRQELLLRAAALWGALLGAIAALVLGGFVLWVLYLAGV
jgi:DNA-binding transcriptional MerR regulator